jgi:hypothetical protein
VLLVGVLLLLLALPVLLELLPQPAITITAAATAATKNNRDVPRIGALSVVDFTRTSSMV